MATSAATPARMDKLDGAFEPDETDHHKANQSYEDGTSTARTLHASTDNVDPFMFTRRV